MSRGLAQRLVDTLPGTSPGLFNPWATRCALDSDSNGPETRLERLTAHLDCQAQWVLFGEAPGYLGCRYSGVAFTSERLVISGAIPRVPREPGRLTTAKRPLSEPSATIVWQALYALGIAETTLLWNAVQLHPHRTEKIHSNRTPSPAELELGKPALEILVEAFPQARLVAVGNKAADALARIGVVPAGKIRHPANGGKAEFVAGLEALVGERCRKSSR